jgi:hypothetical protein
MDQGVGRSEVDPDIAGEQAKEAVEHEPSGSPGRRAGRLDAAVADAG